MRNFYKLQILSGSTRKNHVDEVLKDSRITSHIDYAGVAFENLNKGDVLLIHKGSNPVCLVEILYKIENKSEISGVNFGINYKIEILSYYKDLPESLTFKKENQKVGHNGTFFHMFKDSRTLRFIQQWFEYIQRKKNMEKTKQLLEYKKQIILQGPPGTGKTRLAEMMAESMTKTVKKISPITAIDNFFKTFQINETILSQRTALNEQLQEFTNKFKHGEIKNLSLEDYALGNGNKDGFCYLLEYQLKATGKYNGQANKGKIYFNSKEDIYVKSGFLEGMQSDTAAMEKLAAELDKVVNEKFDDGVNFEIGRNFVLKILNTYHPDKYFPINSEDCLDNALKLFGFDYSQLNYIEKSTQLQSLFLSKKQEFGTDVTNNEFMHFLFQTFNLKNKGKFEDNQLIIEGDYKIIQFHPAYSYEDFVRGISVKAVKDGVSYEVEDRILIEMCEEAASNPEAKYVLIIDEINRANLPSVLGELIYALEYREKEVDGVYDKTKDGIETDRKLSIPSNLLIIGTMNTADRSAGHIDYAIKRRFAFVDVLPEIEPVHHLIKNEFIKISQLFVKNFDGSVIPGIIEKSDALASDFRPEDIWIGHSYFICKKKNSTENEEDDIAKPILNMKLKYEIIPLLKEYIKDGILNETEQVKKVMNELISKDFTK